MRLVERTIITLIVQKRLNGIPPALLLAVHIVDGAFAGTLGLMMAALLPVISMMLVKTICQEDILGNEPVKG